MFLGIWKNPNLTSHVQRTDSHNLFIHRTANRWLAVGAGVPHSLSGHCLQNAISSLKVNKHHCGHQWISCLLVHYHWVWQWWPQGGATALLVAPLGPVVGVVFGTIAPRSPNKLKQCGMLCVMAKIKTKSHMCMALLKCPAMFEWLRWRKKLKRRDSSPNGLAGMSFVDPCFIWLFAYYLIECARNCHTVATSCS